MVILKNDIHTLDHHDFLESFLKDKETDCILYSKEGMKFSIHKEIFCHTQLMRNILRSAINSCCREIEIFCPCSEDELESIVNFLYCGTFSYYKDTDVTKFQKNLANIFGFTENLFFVEDCSMLTKPPFAKIEEVEVIQLKTEENFDERTV